MYSSIYPYITVSVALHSARDNKVEEMTIIKRRLIGRMLEDFSEYASGIMDGWDDQKTADTIGFALVSAESAVNGWSSYLEGAALLRDSKEVRRYLAEILTGAASLNLLVEGVPDSIAKPARLTIKTLLKQWCDRAQSHPVSED